MPHPRTLVGKLLLKKKSATSSGAPVTTAPSTPSDADRKLEQAHQKVQAGLDTLAQQINALPIDALKVPLDRLATTLRAHMATLGTLPDTAARSARLMQIGEGAVRLQQELAKVRNRITEVQQHKADWADKPTAALQRTLGRVSVGTRTTLLPALSRAQILVRETQAALQAGQLDEADAKATEAYWVCDDANKRIATLEKLDVVKTAHGQAATLLRQLKAHPQYATAFAAQSALLEGAVNQAKALLAAGERASPAQLDDIVTHLTQAERASRKSLAEYADYQRQYKQLDSLLKALKAHPQAQAIHAETTQIDLALLGADNLGAHAQGGWHRAKVALAPLAGQCAQAKALADKLGQAAAQLPVLTKQLEGKGIAKDDITRVANMAHKLLVEEDCDAETAVQMAQSAHQFTGEGLDEPDALRSARVKRVLMGDKTISEEHAHAIGKSVRARGTASIEDIQCVADEMKRMSPKALKALNDAGVVTGICRGPVTDMVPELADVNPRGWGDRTWDEVPGCYMGNKKTVIVGTMDDGSGKRKVPAQGEGPIPHGTPDLLGHEAGHAFDVAGGGNKRNDPRFVAARTRDLAEPPPKGLTPGRDDYFMTRTESPTGNQTGDDGARSESFAESFALHFSGHKTKWPNMLTFWQGNPWGV